MVRYRLLGAAFALVAALAPLAFAAALLRPAAAVGGGSPGRLEGLVLPCLQAAAALAAVLLTALALDVVRVLRVKRRAAMFGSVPVRGARLGTSDAVATPTAIGYLHPAVIVPAGFGGRVDPGEWDAVVAHECAHLARGDDWAKAAQSTLLRAGWWLPGLWLLGRALDLERELASDERAVRSADAHHYAACLLRLATDRAGDVAPALWGRRAHLAIRVERLLRPSAGGGPIVRAVALGGFSATALAVALAALVAVPGTRSAATITTAPHAAAARRIAARPVRHPARPHRLAAVPAPRVPRLSAPHHPALVATAPLRHPAAPHSAALPAAAAVPVAATLPAAAALAVPPPAAGPADPRSPAAAHRARPAAPRPVPRTVAWAAPPRRPCRTCLGPRTDGFGVATSRGSAPAQIDGDGGDDGLSRVLVLWIRLPSPAPNP